MTLAAVRLAMMDRFADISGIIVPPDPLPLAIADKYLMIFPKMGPSEVLGRGRDRSITFSSTKAMDVEYHRLIPYHNVGEVVADVTEMIDTIEQMAWGEMAQGGTKFGDTVRSIENVALMHVGALGWNEWTWGARMEITFTYHGEVA